MVAKRSRPENEFIDRLGRVAEGSGLTRITGRIWGLLIISGSALAPADIAAALKVSRASVSTSIRLLETFELLDAETRPGDRQTYYVMREQPYTSMIRAQIKRTTADLAVVDGALEGIKAAGARKRLEDLASFYRITLEGYESILGKLDALPK